MRPYKILYSPYKILELVERDIFSTESISPIYPVFLLTVATVPIANRLERLAPALVLLYCLCTVVLWFRCLDTLD